MLSCFNEFQFKADISRRAIGSDKIVARLNIEVTIADHKRDWSEPYRISKLIRGLVRVIKTCWLLLQVNKPLVSIIGFVWKCFIRSSKKACGPVELEAGERDKLQLANHAQTEWASKSQTE